MSASTPRVGIDFGTSSSALALAGPDGEVRFAQLPTLGALGSSWRTLLFFDPDEQPPREPIQYAAGGEAIAAYLECLGEGRLLQSFKSHLTTASLGRTQIRRETLLPLILSNAAIQRELGFQQRAAEQHPAP